MYLFHLSIDRGKQGEEEFEDEGRVVGKFKASRTNFCKIDFAEKFPTFTSLLQGSIKIYKLPLPKDLDDHTVMGCDPQFGFFQASEKYLLFYISTCLANMNGGAEKHKQN